MSRFITKGDRVLAVGNKLVQIDRLPIDWKDVKNHLKLVLNDKEISINETDGKFNLGYIDKITSNEMDDAYVLVEDSTVKINSSYGDVNIIGNDNINMNTQNLKLRAGSGVNITAPSLTWNGKDLALKDEASGNCYVHNVIFNISSTPQQNSNDFVRGIIKVITLSNEKFNVATFWDYLLSLKGSSRSQDVYGYVTDYTQSYQNTPIVKGDIVRMNMSDSFQYYVILDGNDINEDRTGPHDFTYTEFTLIKDTVEPLALDKHTLFDYKDLPYHSFNLLDTNAITESKVNQLIDSAIGNVLEEDF